MLAAPAGTGAPGQRFLHVLNHIQHHLFENEHLRIAGLAAQVRISPSYFSEYFRRHAGESLQTYLIKSRLQVAEARLLHSENSAKEIAYELGFTDASHLSRAFRKQYGCTIQQFRQRGAFHLLKTKLCTARPPQAEVV